MKILSSARPDTVVMGVLQLRGEPLTVHLFSENVSNQCIKSVEKVMLLFLFAWGFFFILKETVFSLLRLLFQLFIFFT